MAALQKYFINPSKNQPVSQLYDTINYLSGFNSEGGQSQDGVINNAPTSFESTVTFDGEVIANNNLAISGNSTFNGSIISNGENVFTNKNTFRQTSIFNGDIQSNGNNIFSGSNTFSSVANATKGLNLNGNSTFNGKVSVPGAIALSGTYSCNGRQTIKGNTVVESDARYSFYNTPIFNKGLTVDGTATFNSNVSVNTLNCTNNIGATGLNITGSGTIKNLASTSLTAATGKFNGNVNVTGTLTASQVYNAVYNDYAELFPKGEETEPGDIIALDCLSSDEKYIKARKGSKLIVGVHSNEYAHLIGGEVPPDGEDFIQYNLKKYIPIGLAGRLYVKVIGSIRRGDKITISKYPGIGEKSTNSSDQIVGYALESGEFATPGLVKIKIL